MPDAGAIIECIRLTVGRSPDTVVGKPSTAAGEILRKRFNLPAEKIAMVGDRLYTDIAFGNNCGFVSVLVLSGETTEEMLKYSDVKYNYLMGSVQEIPNQI
jgi:NagD protein